MHNSDNQKVNEKREFDRVKAFLPVILLPEINNDPFKDIGFSDTENVSLGGACIPIKKGLTNLENVIQLSLFIPSEEGDDTVKLVSARGNIVRLEKTENSDFLMAGFKFTDLKEEYYDRLACFINKKSSTHPN